MGEVRPQGKKYNSRVCLTPHMPLEKGLVQVYTGEGKGKTTAAVGLGLRAAGQGLKVYMIQFMKGRRYGEVAATEEMENFVIEQFGRDEFVKKGTPEEVDVRLAREGLKRAREIVTGGEWDVVILDEVNVAVDFGLLSLRSLTELIEMKPPHVELVLTGRYARPEVLEMADLVTEMVEVKHPYQKGVLARRGIDF